MAKQKKTEEIKQSLKETASFLELKILDLVREAKAGKINFVKENNGVYFTEKNIEDYMELLGSKDESVTKSEPEPVLEPGWLVRARGYLPNTIDHYISEHGTEKVKTVINNFSSLGDEELVTKIFAADKEETILNLKNGDLANYFNTLYGLVGQINEKFADEVPEAYSLPHSPERFLPGNIDVLNLEFNPPKQQPKKKKDSIDLICEELSYERELVEGLTSEGYNVYYLDAVIKDGLNIKPSSSNNLCINKNYKNGKNFFSDIISGLNKNGISHDKKIVSETMEKLGELIDTYKSRDGGCYYLNSQWRTIAEGYTLEYLQKAFDDIKEQNGKR